ncbi:CMP/dCMP kinase [Nematocida homosporus]|uniref:CMP/dCMP kinase n=1 Tax=Nematocida homosporus TaxID=1912981 RepID=UPI00222128A4|nr:CMP/dCMP kinase [Nematocida homosporus]KAI5184739.1 CMP/dCMP kinase [Nematocida homosporus]
MVTNTTTSKPFRIAIDGPAGAGKSTLATALAARLSLVHINTGIIYRALSYVFLHSYPPNTPIQTIKSDLDQETPAIIATIKHFNPDVNEASVYLNHTDITPFLRTHEIDAAVGIIAKYPAVRAKVGEIQKDLIQKYLVPGVVVEGRDIGTVIMPEAEVKIFLVASVEVRAKRRALENHENNIHQIEKEIKQRDRMDVTREISPLVRADDAVIIDNSVLTIEETVDKIAKLVAERRK